jgi:acylphosphatase
MMRTHVIISGRVQGVFFRSETKNMADQLGLTGWVKNRPDGKVEAVFEGPKEQVLKMLDWCKKGPISAKVEKVERTRDKVEKEEYRGFEIRY